jgi:hypothetical protein
MASPEQRAWIERVLGIQFDLMVGLNRALKAWEAELASVIQQIRALGSAIKAAEDPEADEAISLLESIVENLRRRPDSANAVRELEDYLIAEDLIDEAERPNGFGVTVAIRAPLSNALEAVKRALPK